MLKRNSKLRKLSNNGLKKRYSAKRKPQPMPRQNAKPPKLSNSGSLLSERRRSARQKQP